MQQRVSHYVEINYEDQNKSKAIWDGIFTSDWYSKQAFDGSRRTDCSINRRTASTYFFKLAMQIV